jgi:tyrosinase
VNQHGTISTAPGTIEDVSSPLLPFARDHSGNMHTAATVRHIKSLGYTYPELLDWTMTTEDLALSVNATITKLYGNSALYVGLPEEPAD